MGRKRRSVPVPLAWRPVKSQRRARQITSVFHKLTHARETAQRHSAGARKPSENGGKVTDTADHDTEPQKAQQISAEEQQLAQQLHALGGRRLYQAASALATARNTSSSKWIFKTITALGRRPVGKGLTKPTLLEVGAVNTQLLACRWLDVTAIDIRSQHPRIQQVDFLDYGNIHEGGRFGHYSESIRRIGHVLL